MKGKVVFSVYYVSYDHNIFFFKNLLTFWKSNFKNLRNSFKKSKKCTDEKH